MMWGIFFYTELSGTLKIFPSGVGLQLDIQCEQKTNTNFECDGSLGLH